jgi:hypothetical protein
VTKWGNIWILIYTLSSAAILNSGEIWDFGDHNECVLYKSGAKAVPPPDLPKTGPAEFFLLLILAMVLGFGVLKYRENANSY